LKVYFISKGETYFPCNLTSNPKQPSMDSS
jgi:hypothetical protein